MTLQSLSSISVTSRIHANNALILELWLIINTEMEQLQRLHSMRRNTGN